MVLMHAMAMARVMHRAQHVSCEGADFAGLLTWDSLPPGDQHCQSPTAASAVVLDSQSLQLPECMRAT